jgi:hypothetical protein
MEIQEKKKQDAIQMKLESMKMLKQAQKNEKRYLRRA